MKRILLAEDEVTTRRSIRIVLNSAGYYVEEAKDGQEAIEKHEIFKPSLTIMDPIMLRMGGLDAIFKIQESDPEAKFAVFTPSSKKDEVEAAKTLNVLSYIIKPLNIVFFQQ